MNNDLKLLEKIIKKVEQGKHTDEDITTAYIMINDIRLRLRDIQKSANTIKKTVQFWKETII